MPIRRTGYPRRLVELYDFLDLAYVVKQADQTVTASTVLVADTELKVPLLKGAKYRVNGVIFFDTTAAGDFKWRHTGPASPTRVRIGRRSVVAAATADTNIAQDVAFSGSDIAEVGAGTDGGMILFFGIIHNGVNAGNFGISWAQNTSDAGNTIVRAGSYISATLLQ